MKKKFIILILLFVITINIFPMGVKAQEREVKLLINGEYVETEGRPFLKDGRTLVPIRVISETLGYDVDWDENLVTVTISKWSDRYNSYQGLFVLNVDSKVVVSYDLEKVNKLFGRVNPSEEEVKNVMEESAKTSEIDVAPTVINGRTYVPVRVIAEAMGEKISWDNENWTVIINSNE
ncbi:MAG: copper amine oxidase N-terminal domain-containing protein [Neofamilia sp.]